MTLPVPWIVWQPSDFWVARRRDVPSLIDPHVDDGRVRHADRDEIDWGQIARFLTQASLRLPTARVEKDGWGTVLVPAQLPTDERARTIIASFGKQTTMSADFDPGDEQVSNGRHRLWACFNAAPDAALPIRSCVLSDFRSAPHEAPGFLEIVRREVARVEGQARASLAGTNEAANEQFLERLNAVNA